MSFLSRLFGSRTRAAKGEDIEVRLAYLEKEAEKAKPGYVGSALNKAGDLALKADQPDRAVVFYGRAIDAFLDDAQRELARGVANKIIRVRPTAIRTLCTITWLDLAARHQASALMHLRDYVSAASEAGQQPRAATQIHLMAAISPDSEFIDAVADALDALDYPRRAKEVRSWIAIGAPDALDEALALADACMQAAVRSNHADISLLIDDPEAVDTVNESEGADESDPGVDTGAPIVADARAPEEPSAETEAEPPVAADSETEAEPPVAADAEPDPEPGAAAEPEPAADPEPKGDQAESAPEEEAAADGSADDPKPSSSKGRKRKSGKSKKKRKKKRKG